MALALALRTLVLGWLPNPHEKLQSGWSILSLRNGPSHADQICWISPKEWGVNLGFPEGVDLPDPQGLLIALSGNASPTRNVRLEHGADLADPALEALVIAALAL